MKLSADSKPQLFYLVQEFLRGSSVYTAGHIEESIKAGRIANGSVTIDRRAMYLYFISVICATLLQDCHGGARG
jgi:hypothetical protein